MRLVLANGGSLADVGVAAGLVAAGVVDALVVADSPASLGEGAAGVVSSVLPSGVLVVGGQAAVSDEVVAQLRVLSPGVVAERLWGATRVGTAAVAARRVLGAGGNDVRVALASGWSLADVGAAASLVAAGGADAVLYGGRDGLGDETAQLLGDYRPQRIELVGGPAALSEQVRAEAVAAAGAQASSRRLWGATRIETAARVARVAAGDCVAAAVIANGWSQPDVGAAAALAAAWGNSVVLYARSATDLGDAARQAIADIAPQGITLVGDTDTLAEALRDALPAGRSAQRLADPHQTARRALKDPPHNCTNTGNSNSGGGGTGTRGGGGTGGGGGTTTVTTTPPGTPTVSFGRASYTAAEGGTPAAVTVLLSQASSQTVTVPLDVTPHGGATPDDYTTPSQVTFNAGQTTAAFTVTAADDNDNDDGESITIGFGNLPTGVTAGTPFTTTVNLDDDDTADLVVSRGSLTVGEDGDGTFTVRLATRPTHQVSVTVTSGDSSAASVPAQPLTFTTGNWETAQSVTVSGVHDDDTRDESVTVTLSASGGDYAGETATVAVSVDDDDTADLVVSRGSLTVGEDGDGTFTVRLATRPTHQVSVTVTSGDSSAASVPAQPLTFTTGNWETAQSVTVSGVHDDDTRDESVTVTLSASGGDYAGETATVAVSVDDDDTADLVVSRGSLTVGEDGDGTFTVRLATRPTHQVSVTVTSGDSSAASVPAQPLTFTTGNWETAQSVTVSGVHDDDTRDESVTVTLSASGGDYAGETATVAVSVDDNDTTPTPTPTVRFGASQYAATEGGAAAAVTVELTTALTHEVTVPVTATPKGGATTDDYTLSPTPVTVTFAAGHTTATFTVAATDDTVYDDKGERVKLGFGILPDGVAAAAPRTSHVSLVDNENPPQVTVRFGEASYTATEGGTPATVIVTLSADPERAVTVRVEVTAHSGATAKDYRLPASRATFARGETTKQITVTAVADCDDDEDESITIGFGDLPQGVSEDTSATAIATALVSLIDVSEPSTEPFARVPCLDVHPLTDRSSAPAKEWFTEPRDLWSDGVTLWLLSDAVSEYVYAYNLDTGARDRGKDIPIAYNSRKGQHWNQIPYPWGMWSDGEILRVVDRTRDKIFAFDLGTGVYRSDLNIASPFNAGNRNPTGMWSDGEIVWVTDYILDKIFAYELDGGARRSERDIDTLASNGVQHPTSLWSDGITIWVLDDRDDRIYAFDLATKVRKSDLDFATMTAADNHNLHGMWSNGVTMWVTDHNDDRVYAYNMPVTSALTSLSAAGVDFGLFQPGVTNYQATVAAGTTSTAVTAVAAFTSTTVAVSYVGGDMSTGTNTTVPLSAGENIITITATNGDQSHTYTLTVTVPAS